MTQRSRSYIAGWEYAEQALGDQPREVREAAARHMGDEQIKLPVWTDAYMALSGGLAYLTKRHEEDA